MTTDQQTITNLAKLVVHEYFDHYLNEVWPKNEARLVSAMQTAITTHNQDVRAHAGVARRFDRFFWVLIGVSMSSGIGIGTLITALTQAVNQVSVGP